MPRGGRKRGGGNPATDVGCGYKARVSGANKVTIFPTVLGSNCNLTVGLGDATFTFDPTDPPKTITRIITKDADGSYAPPSKSGMPRIVKYFDSAEDTQESFTDADGHKTDLTYKKLNGANYYVSSGMRYEISTKGNSGFGSRTSGSFRHLYSSVTVPKNISINTSQVTNIYRGNDNGDDGYAFIDNNTLKLNVITKDINQVIDMGNDANLADLSIIEFTIIRAGYGYVEFYIKNFDDIARKVLVTPHKVKYGNLEHNIIKVIGGKAIKKHSTDYAVADKSYMPLMENGAVDAILTDGKDVEYIFPDNSKTNIIKRVQGYTLKKGNKLYKGNTLIANDVFDMGYFFQHSASPILVGKAGNTSNNIVNSVMHEMQNAGVHKQYFDEYVSFYNSQTKPTCGWAGSGVEVAHTATYGECKKLVNPVNTTSKFGILVAKTNGKIYKIKPDDTLEEQIFKTDYADGFKALYEENHRDKFILFPKRNSGVPSVFSQSEVGQVSSFIFQ